jgi:hypothetical protein
MCVCVCMCVWARAVKSDENEPKETTAFSVSDAVLPWWISFIYPEVLTSGYKCPVSWEILAVRVIFTGKRKDGVPFVRKFQYQVLSLRMLFVFVVVVCKPFLFLTTRDYFNSELINIFLFIKYSIPTQPSTTVGNYALIASQIYLNYTQGHWILLTLTRLMQCLLMPSLGVLQRRLYM